MAKEWYLITPPYSMASGFESDALNDYKADALADIANSGAGVDVTIYNYDLSESYETKAIIQGRTQDSKLASTQRQMFTPIGTCKAGMYVKYKDKFWLIVGLVDDNTVYEKSILYLCNYLLTWVNASGKVIQRWCYAASASQYNNGETGERFYTVRSDQLMVFTPDDDECLLIADKQRFVIDRRCQVYEKDFDESVVKDTSKPIIVYALTRHDSVLYDYQGSGHFAFMAYQEEQQSDDGYYVIDGKGYWLCNGQSTYDESKKETVSALEIECDAPEVYDGLEPSIFTANFYDESGNKVDNVEPEWKIVCDFANELEVDYVDKSVMISSNNQKLVNKSFELFLSAEGYESKSLTVYIKAFI